MRTPGDQSPLGSEIVVSLAVHRDFKRHVDLMMGFHPDEKRELTELEERAADYATLLAPNRSHNDDRCLRQGSITLARYLA